MKRPNWPVCWCVTVDMGRSERDVQGAGRMQRLRGKENRFQLSHNQASTRPNTQQYIASAAKHMPTNFGESRSLGYGILGCTVASNSVVHALGSQRSSTDHRFVQPPPPPPHRQHAYMTQHSVRYSGYGMMYCVQVDVLQSTPPNTPAAIVGYIMNDNSPGASFNRPYNQSANSAARYKPVGQEDTIDERELSDYCGFMIHCITVCSGRIRSLAP